MDMSTMNQECARITTRRDPAATPDEPMNLSLDKNTRVDLSQSPDKGNTRSMINENILNQRHTNNSSEHQQTNQFASRITQNQEYLQNENYRSPLNQPYNSIASSSQHLPSTYLRGLMATTRCDNHVKRNDQIRPSYLFQDQDIRFNSKRGSCGRYV